MGYIQVQQDAKIQYRNVQSFFDQPPAQRDIPARKPFEPVKGNIEIQNLGLAYSDNIRVLENISLSINAGEMVALVGGSGSGKSSLMNCLAGKIRQYEGAILVGGNDIKKLNSPDLAPFLGVVSQFPYIFDGSLRQNLLYPVKASGVGQEPNQDDMILALQQAGLFPDLLLFGLNRVPQPEFYDMAGQELDQMRDMVREGLPRDIRDQIRFFPKNTNLKKFTLLEQILGGKPETMDATAVMNWLPKLVPLLITYDLLEIIMPFSFFAHAKDIYTQNPAQLKEKLALAAFTVTCTRYNLARLRSLCPGARLHCVYHGINQDFFNPCKKTVPDPCFKILTVARHVPKKGLDLVIRAMALAAERVMKDPILRERLIQGGAKKSQGML